MPEHESDHSNASWHPDAEGVILRASMAKRLRSSRWSFPDRKNGKEFLQAIGFKKAPFVPLGGTIAMLLEERPKYFIPYAPQVLLSDISVYGSGLTESLLARNSWLGNGSSLRSVLANPLRCGTESEQRLTSGDIEWLFHVWIPDIRTWFGSLLEGVSGDQ